MLQLWYRLAARAPSQALVWELPYATGVALKKAKKKKKITIWPTAMKKEESEEMKGLQRM